MRKHSEIFLYPYPKQKIVKKIALVFPERYEVGMASLGFQGVYHLLQSSPFLSVERFFYQGNHQPLSVETGRPLDEFDVIMVSLSFETDILHLIEMLTLSHIPIENSQRSHPPLIVGGIGCSLLAGYLKKIANILVATDAEFAIPIVIDALLSSHEDWWLSCGKYEGLYLPEDTSSHHLPFVSHPVEKPLHTVILTPENEFPMRGLIEISRSCLYRCRFCLVSHVYGAYRPFSREHILSTAQLYQGKTNQLGLVAATLTNHPESETLIDDLNRMGFELSFSAFRIETLSPRLLEKIIINEKKTLVLAPESASEKHKHLLRKMIPNDVFLERVKQATAIGIKRIKLYFLIGLPEETESDLYDMVHLIQEISRLSKQQAKTYGYTPEIIVDINPLVPKPFTELAHVKMEDVATLKKKILFLKRHIHGLGRVFVSGESPRRAHLQYDLAWGNLSWDEILSLSKHKHP
ncbi:MAG: B12-binding domain-containing radical SAM protein [Brevinematales bacterium]|nr:B12-binding domain-containing radical SAM protein [Brevinematales bacterium]